MNLLRCYDHLLGEHWAIEDHGVVLGMFFGPTGKTRAERRLATIQHKPEPLQRSLEARARLLEALRRQDTMNRAELNQERRERRRSAR